MTSTEMEVTTPSKTTVERIYEIVREKAITYQFRPGERINEVELAASMDVSRTPLREALNRLTSEGFIVTQPNRGFFGRRLDPKEIFDLYELRNYLEQTAVSLACLRATHDEMLAVQDFLFSLRNLDRSAGSVEMLQADEEFHLKIVRLSKNKELVKNYESVVSKIHFVRWIDAQERNRGQDQHAVIIRLLIERQDESCRKYLNDHIMKHFEDIVEIIKMAYSEIYTREESGIGRTFLPVNIN